jgi:hypothetical protein
MTEGLSEGVSMTISFAADDDCYTVAPGSDIRAIS